MITEEQNTEKMTAGQLGRYREELLAQLSDTLEYLHKANLETNSRDEGCIHNTNEDIREQCARNAIHI